MKPLTILEKILDWIENKFYYNCKKGRHKWGYTLSETGTIYLDDSKVPKDAWKCLNCGIKKFK